MGTERNHSSDQFTKFRPITRQVLFMILALVVSLLTALTAVNYFSSKRALISGYEHLQAQTEENIRNALIMVDTSYKMIEYHLEVMMREDFPQFIAAYKKAGMDPEKINLEALARRFNNKYVLYIIDEDAIIRHSTSQDDIGLDFNEWGMGDYIKGILKGSEFASSRMDPAFMTGKLMKFAYMPSPDNRYVLEFGHEAGSFAEILKPFSPSVLSKGLREFNPYLRSVRLFNREKFLLDDPDFRPDGKLASILDSMFSEKRTVESSSGRQASRYIFVDLSSQRYGSDPSLAVELVYETGSIQADLKKIAFQNILVGFIAILTSVFIAYLISRKVTRPIKQLVYDVGIISEGNLEHEIGTSRVQEFGILSNCISTMVSELKDNITRLELYQFALNKTQDEIYLINPDASFSFANDAACKSLGYSKAEMSSMGIPDIDPIYQREQWEKHWTELREHKSRAFETIHRKKDGETFPVEVSANYFKYEDREYNLALARDISKRKQAEEGMRASLEEKEVLLKEIHHRVKNNMAVISSLLSLQSGYVDDKKYLDMFSESQSRISAMALVHEKLYQSKDFVHIDVRDYIESLAKSIKTTFAGNMEIISRIDVHNIVLDIDVLVPCGLIINEILTNSFKHAFNDHASPEIIMSMTKTDDENVLLTIADNGNGLPDGFDMSESKGLGLKLVSVLVGQINGNLKLKSERGVTFTITLPTSIEHARHLS